MKKYCNVYSTFTAIFIVFILLGLLPSEIKTGYPFGFGLYSDGFKQHLLFMRDYVTQIKGFFRGEPFSIYRFNMGLGSDFFLSYCYYSLFDPLTIIAYLLPIEHIEFSYYLIAVLRLYLAGIFLILLAKELGIKKNRSLLIAAVFYCFNITVLYSAFRHPFFTNGPLLLPLVILGAEKYIRKGNPFLLVFVSFFGLITQFYFYVYISFGFILYVFLRLLPKIKNKSFRSFLKNFVSIAFVYALGALLGGFVLVPQLVGTFMSSRTSTKGFLLYNAYDLLNYLLSFFVPIVGRRYSSTIGNFYIFFIILTYVLNTRKTLFKTYFLILAALLFLPFFGYAINGFTYINNRWTFLLILPAALILGRFMEEELDGPALNKALKVFFILISLLAVLALSAWAEKTRNILLIVLAALFLVCLFPVLTFIRKRQFKMTGKLFSSRHIYRITLISSFLLVLGFGFACTFFLTTSEGLSAYEDKSAFSDISSDDSFFRIDQNKYALNSDFLGNDGLAHGLPAVHYYNTMNNGYVNDVIKFFNVSNHNNTIGYNGFDERSALNAINHVKYMLVRESEKQPVPYGFELHATTELQKFDESRFNNYTQTGYLEYNGQEKVYEKVHIFRNENFINFGFVYHEYVKNEDLENLTYVGRENALLSAVILEDDCGLPKHEPLDLEPLKPEFESENIIFEPGKIISGSGGGLLRFTVEAEAAELYVEILGLRALNKKQFTVFYETEYAKKEERNYAYGTYFYYENPDHLVNLGYYESGILEVRIHFEEGEYEFSKINYYLNPVAEIQEKAAKLNSETLEDLKFNASGFSGKISLDAPGMLFISLPYSSGFKAYVNGVRTEIEKANVGYMGVFLDAGSHEVEFVYETPGMKVGLLASLMSVGILLTLGLMCIKKKAKVRDETNQELL